MKITKEEFDELYDENIIVKRQNEILHKIDDRFSEICKKFLKIKPNRGWFDYDSVDVYSENSCGYFCTSQYRDQIYINGEWIDPPKGYDLSFPTRWLWEDFEEELASTTAAAEIAEVEAKAKKKQKLQDRKEKRKELAASIKSKLTSEELKCITFKK